MLQYGFKIAWELSTTKYDGLGNTHMRQLRFLPALYVTFSLGQLLSTMLFIFVTEHMGRKAGVFLRKTKATM